MKIENAIKKIKKLGLSLSQKTQESGRINCWIAGQKDMLSFWSDDKGEIDLIKVQGLNDKDDIQMDHFAGVYCDNLTQALKMFDK